jgi:phosphoserine phosphatase
MAGDLDFAQSLRERVLTLKGLPESVFADVFARIQPTDGVQELIDAIHAADGLVAAVSGGFTQVLTPLAAKLGLDFARANDLEIIDGKLTGFVSGQIVDRQVKADSLVEWATAAGISKKSTIAVGDGANDLAMMQVAGLGVAFNAKPIVQAQANIVIGKQDLRELIPVLGL